MFPGRVTVFPDATTLFADAITIAADFAIGAHYRVGVNRAYDLTK